MPTRYQKQGLSFEYPDKWEVEEDDVSNDNLSVTVYSPAGGAFWTVTCQPRTRLSCWLMTPTLSTGGKRAALWQGRVCWR